MKIPSVPIRVVVLTGPNGKWVMSEDKTSSDRHHCGSQEEKRHLQRGLFLPTPDFEKSLPFDRKYVAYDMAGTEQSPYEPHIFAPQDPVRDAETFDGPEYLGAFLDIKNQADGLAFLNKYGNPEEPTYTGFERICEIQHLLGKAAVTPIQKWNEQLPDWATPKRIDIEIGQANLDANLKLRRQLEAWLAPSIDFEIEEAANLPLSLVSQYTVGAVACFAQIFFEKIQGLQFALCELDDCDRLFRKTRPDKKHCCSKHQHLAVVQKSRAAKKATHSQ